MDILVQIFILSSSFILLFAVKLGVERIGPAWDVISNKRVEDLKQRAEAISLDVENLNRYLRIWGLCLLAIPVFIWFVLDLPLIALGSIYFVYVTPVYVLDWLIARRRQLLRDQMVRATQFLANAARAGLNLQDGLREVVQESKAPLSYELQRIVAGRDAGQSLSEALDAARVRIQLEPFTLFAIAIQITLERGGRLDEAMNRICGSLTDAQRIERKLRADTASGKRATVILSLFPFGFMALFYVLDPDTMSLLFTTIIGQAVLMLVIILVYIGCKVALRIMDIQP